MAEAIATVATIYKYGRDVYDFLKQCTDDDIRMKCKFSSDPTDNTITFTAFDHSNFFIKFISASQNPWRLKEENDEPDRFGVIEIVCENKEEYRHIILKYQGKTEVFLQHDIIEYLQIISGRFAQVSMKAMVMKTGEFYNHYQHEYMRWNEWKLIYTIQ